MTSPNRAKAEAILNEHTGNGLVYDGLKDAIESALDQRDLEGKERAIGAVKKMRDEVDYGNNREGKNATAGAKLAFGEVIQFLAAARSDGEKI